MKMILQWLARIRNTSAFGRYLLLTNTVSYCSLLGLGDVVVQTIERYATCDREEDGTPGRRRPYDWARTGRMFALGLLTGPLNHGFYSVMDRYLPSTTGRTVVKKVLVDQMIGSPFFAFTFFIGMGTLEGKTSEASLNEFKAKFWTVYKADWCLWPAAQAINFAFLPASFRVIYIAVVTLGWNTFLSYMKHKDDTEEIKNVESERLVSSLELSAHNQSSLPSLSKALGPSGLADGACDDLSTKSSTVLIPGSPISRITAAS